MSPYHPWTKSKKLRKRRREKEKNSRIHPQPASKSQLHTLTPTPPKPPIFANQQRLAHWFFHSSFPIPHSDILDTCSTSRRLNSDVIVRPRIYPSAQLHLSICSRKCRNGLLYLWYGWESCRIGRRDGLNLGYRVANNTAVNRVFRFGGDVCIHQNTDSR